MKCNQKDPQCELPPAFRFTWPGKDEAVICTIHAAQLANIAAAIDLYLQLIPLEDEVKS